LKQERSPLKIGFIIFSLFAKEFSILEVIVMQFLYLFVDCSLEKRNLHFAAIVSPGIYYATIAHELNSQ